MPLQYETVAFPVVKGIDVTTKARLIEAPGLLEAVNSRFPTGGGASKRRGHAGRRVRNNKPIPADITLPELTPPLPVAPFYTGDRGIPSDWLFGWGYLISPSRVSAAAAIETSPHPDAGLLFGAFNRDNETVAWNGYELLSRSPEQPEGAAFSTIGPAVMPALRASAVAKVARPQSQPDIADTNKIRVVAWIDLPDSDVWYTVVDSVTGATLVAPRAMGYVAPVQVRCIPVGGWVHLLVVETSTGKLMCTSLHEADPTTAATKSLGDCPRFFDAWKQSESAWWVARNTGTLAIEVTKFNNDSVVADDSPTTLIAVTNAAATVPSAIYAVAIAIHPVNGDIGLVWRATYSSVVTAQGRTYSSAGAAISAAVLLHTCITTGDTTDRPVACAPKYLWEETATKSVFNGYVDDHLDTGVLNTFRDGNTVNFPHRGKLVLARFSGVDTVPSYISYRYGLSLGSQAFRVGDRTFVWASIKSPAQSIWVMLDEQLNPIGKLDYGIANTLNTQAGDFPHLASVNWSGSSPLKDLLVYHTGLGFKERVVVATATAGTNPPIGYTEPSVRYVALDFLPKLHSTQAGRCRYIAGAQLWCYDGSTLVEAGFHTTPEALLANSGGISGELEETGDYTYRVDLCHKNAQGEEVRSASFYTKAIFAFSVFGGYTPTAAGGLVVQGQVLLAGDNEVDITLLPCLTTRPDSYFLIFRNESAGTQWYLVNSRDPSSALFVKNDRAVEYVVFNDNGIATPNDAELISQELHPGNAGIFYIDQAPAQACEFVAYGKDRLWVGGGEVPTGQVSPSRLFAVGSVPGFNPALNIQVDRSAEPITAVGFVGDLVAVFRRNSTYIIEGEGTDNVSTGVWSLPRLAYADLGALNQATVAFVASGLVFESATGLRLLEANGRVQAIGAPVDTLAVSSSISSALVCGGEQEIRWYTSSGTIVYSYATGVWSTWTVAAVGATLNPETGLALVARADGWLWEETDGLWTDNGALYKHRIRFAWLRAQAGQGGQRDASLMDFQRVRRIGALGEWDPTQPHSVHVDVYYDEREFAEETFDWDVPQDADDPSMNTDTFGSATFGAGVFGDNE